MNRRLLMAAFLALLVALTLFDVSPLKVEASPGWLQGYSYRKKHVLVGAANAGVDYQMMFKVRRSSGTDNSNIVYVGSKCKADFSDIRFTDSSGNVFTYAITYLTTDEAWIWIKPSVDLSVNQTIYVYYGNSNAQSEASLDDTFVFAEDWSNSTLQPRWTIEQNTGNPTITIDSGLRRMSISGTSYTCAIRSSKTIVFPSSYRVEDFSAPQYDSSNYYFKLGHSMPGTSTVNDWARSALSIHHSTINTNDFGVAFIQFHAYYLSGSKFYVKTGVGHNEDKSYALSQNYKEGYFAVSRNASDYFNIVCTTWSSVSHTEFNTENPNRIYLYAAATVTSTAYFFPFKIRKYVNPEPSHGEWFPEETATGLQSTISVSAYPSWVPNGYFKLDAEDYLMPYSGSISPGQHNITALDDQITINGSYIFNFKCWKRNGAVYSYSKTCSFTVDLGEEVEFTVVYEAYKVDVSTEPSGLSVTFEADGWELSTPATIYRGPGYHTFKAKTNYINYNSTHMLVFYGWFVNNLYISPEATLNIYTPSNTTVKLGYKFTETPAPPPMTFRAQLVTLGEIAPGATKDFVITVLFDQNAITITKIEFQTKQEWFTLQEPLPKQASRGMEAIGTATIQAQLKAPENVQGYYSIPFIVTATTPQDLTITTASYITFTVTAAAQISEITLTTGGFIETIQRLLGNPILLILLIALIIWLASYSLKKH